MGLFYNNNVAGRGIAKNAPKKKPFFRFWELFLNKFWTFFKLNLVYFLFCIPIVTFGPATAALTAMMRNIYLERPQFIFYDFWRLFKKNFKQSFVIGLVDIAAIALFIFTNRYFAGSPELDTASKIVYILAIAAQVLFLMMNFYIYPQIAALNMKMSGILKNSLLLVFVNVGGELITLAFIASYVTLIVLFGVFVLILTPLLPAAWIVFLSVFCCYPAIQKYVINPYYERIGEHNPELPDEDDDDDGEERVFEDQGGKETPLKLKKEKNKKHGKIIK